MAEQTVTSHGQANQEHTLLNLLKIQKFSKKLYTTRKEVENYVRGYNAKKLDRPTKDNINFYQSETCAPPIK